MHQRIIIPKPDLFIFSVELMLNLLLQSEGLKLYMFSYLLSMEKQTKGIGLSVQLPSLKPVPNLLSEQVTIAICSFAE